MLFSCKDSESEILRIDLAENLSPGNHELSGFAEDVIYIPLETTSNNLLRSIGKLHMNNNGIFYISDYRSLQIYTHEGKFKYQAGKSGRGPGEYSFIDDFTVDESTGTIYILDRRNILTYGEAGNYINNIKATGRPMQIEYIEGNILLYVDNSDGQTEHSFLLIDKYGEVLKQYNNKYKFEPSGPVVVVADGPVRYHFNDTLFIKEAYSDTIFFVDGSEFVPRYIFNQGDGKLAANVYGKDLLTEGYKYISFRRIFETSQFLFASYWWNKSGMYLIRCKNSDNNYVFDNEKGLINDIDGGPEVIPEMAITKGGTEYLVMWLDAFRLKAHVESEAFRNSIPKFPEKKKELEKLAASLDENDNPVLMLVKLKE